ncbi:MAG: hypothetical protein ACK5IH_15880, partial [Betaproteobacteria bacterium]
MSITRIPGTALRRSRSASERASTTSFSLALRDRLNAVPGMRVMLTRDGDYFVPLAERVRKARRV